MEQEEAKSMSYYGAAAKQARLDVRAEVLRAEQEEAAGFSRERLVTSGADTSAGNTRVSGVERSHEKLAEALHQELFLQRWHRVMQEAGFHPGPAESCMEGTCGSLKQAAEMERQLVRAVVGAAGAGR